MNTRNTTLLLTSLAMLIVGVYLTHFELFAVGTLCSFGSFALIVSDDQKH